MKKLIVAIPTPIWAAILLFLAYEASRTFNWQAGLKQVTAAIVLIVIGFLISLTGLLAFLRAGTQLRPDSTINKSVVTQGSYAFTRNPMYLGAVIMSLGVALIVGPWPMYVAVVLVFLLANYVIIPFEEANVERQHGDEFRAYKAKVRRWI